MSGQTSKATYIRRLEKQMQAAAAEQEYERAARLRDDIGALNRALEKQAIVFGDGTDADVIALAQDQLEAAVQVFYVRGGRARGQRGCGRQVEAVTTGDLVEQFLSQVYGGEAGDAVPREVLVPEQPPDVDAWTTWLSGCVACGSRCASRSAATSERSWRPWRALRSRRSVSTRPSARATSPPEAAPRRDPARSACSRRRCASSATTCRTRRAARSSRRWWCSRTAGAQERVPAVQHPRDRRAK